MASKNKSLTFAGYQVVYDNGVHEILFLTPAELAGFKRSKKYKTRISFKKFASAQVTIKISIA